MFSDKRVGVFEKIADVFACIKFTGNITEYVIKRHVLHVHVSVQTHYRTLTAIYSCEIVLKISEYCAV